MKIYVVFIASEQTCYAEIENQTHLFHTKEEAQEFAENTFQKYMESHRPIRITNTQRTENYRFVSDELQSNFLEIITFEKEVK